MSSINLNPTITLRQEKLAAANITPANNSQTATNDLQTVNQTAQQSSEVKRTTVTGASENNQSRNENRQSTTRQPNQRESPVAPPPNIERRENLDRAAAIGTQTTAQLERASAQSPRESAPPPRETTPPRESAPLPRENSRAELPEIDNTSLPDATAEQPKISDLPLSQPRAMQYNLAIQETRRESTAAISATANATREQLNAAVAVQAYQATNAVNNEVAINSSANSSPAMRNLSTNIDVYANYENNSYTQQAASRLNTQNLQADNNTLNTINESLTTIDNQVQTISSATQNTLSTPTNAPTNQRTVNSALDNINSSVGQVQTQSQTLRGMQPGDLSELNSVLRNLGSTPPPEPYNTDNGRPLTLNDLRDDGRAPQATAPELAAQVSQEAAQQLSAVRNTTETMQGNVLSASGNAIANTINSLSRQKVSPDATVAQSSMSSVMSALETSPSEAIQNASRKISQDRVAQLVSGE